MYANEVAEMMIGWNALLSPVWVESVAHVYIWRAPCSRGKVARGSSNDDGAVCDQPMAQVRRYRTRTHAHKHPNTFEQIAHNTNVPT